MPKKLLFICSAIIFFSLSCKSTQDTTNSDNKDKIEVTPKTVKPIKNPRGYDVK